jgi:hypothetical protein
LPVFDLAVLLGHPPDPAARWLALVRSAVPLALAFERFEGQAQVAHADVATPSAGAGKPHVRGSVRWPGGARPLLDVPSIVAAVERTPPVEER